VAGIITAGILYLIPTIQDEIEKTLSILKLHLGGEGLLHKVLPPHLVHSIERQFDVNRLVRNLSIESLLAEVNEVNTNLDSKVKAENGRLEYNINNFEFEEDKSVLRDIKFAVEKGQTLGIVGVTGAGKTTLLRLLLREFNIKSGNIMLNNRDIAEYSINDLRKLIGYVPQDQVLFAMSIKENIRFANPLIDDKKVEEITKICGLYDDIMAMPEKFDTIVGEKGVSLSGGQKQRLAMSRALIINPEILILDDSLSAVDAKTEHVILENLKEQRSGQTNIITAHRLSAVVEADLIIVLGDNTIIEKGTHNELIANNGWYKETYESQQMEESLKGGNEDVEK